MRSLYARRWGQQDAYRAPIARRESAVGNRRRSLRLTARFLGFAFLQRLIPDGLNLTAKLVLSSCARFTLAVTFLTAEIFGLAPAFQASGLISTSVETRRRPERFTGRRKQTA